MAKFNEPGETPGSTDLALHAKLWGHPLPRWTENGMAYVEGSHWTPEAYEGLILWLGEALDAMHLWVYGPDQHRQTLILRRQIASACALAREQQGDNQAFTEAVDEILPSVTLSPTDMTEIDSRVAHAERARKHLWTVASASDPRSRPGTMTELAAWTTKHHTDLVLRLAIVGLVPLPPAAIKPKSMPQHGPSRQAKMDSKPSLDPVLESAFD